LTERAILTGVSFFSPGRIKMVAGSPLGPWRHLTTPAPYGFSVSEACNSIPNQTLLITIYASGSEIDHATYPLSTFDKRVDCERAGRSNDNTEWTRPGLDSLMESDRLDELLMKKRDAH
jgi:hypothetical protein